MASGGGGAAPGGSGSGSGTALPTRFQETEKLLAPTEGREEKGLRGSKSFTAALPGEAERNGHGLAYKSVSVGHLEAAPLSPSRLSLGRASSTATSTAAPEQGRPQDYLVLAIFSCFCPVWPINVVALVFSIMVSAGPAAPPDPPGSPPALPPPPPTAGAGAVRGAAPAGSGGRGGERGGVSGRGGERGGRRLHSSRSSTGLCRCSAPAGRCHRGKGDGWRRAGALSDPAGTPGRAGDRRRNSSGDGEGLPGIRGWDPDAPWAGLREARWLREARSLPPRQRSRAARRVSPGRSSEAKQGQGISLRTSSQPSPALQHWGDPGWGPVPVLRHFKGTGCICSSFSCCGKAIFFH